MGFLGLVPADDLTASYDPRKQLLTLYASGNAQKFTYGFRFYRDQEFVGGLKFYLQGWTGPLSKGTEPYKYTQEFPIQLLTPYYVVNPKEVIIVTLNHQDGVVVPIDWLNSDAPPKGTKTDEKTSPSLGIEAIQPLKDIWVLLDTEFEILDFHELSKDIRINVHYDRKFLEMEDAGTPQGKLKWTFKSLHTGTTQITVTTAIKPIGSQQPITLVVTTYNVHIFLLDVASLKLYSGLGEQESFLGNVNVAVRIVQNEYPDAKLYEVDASLPKPNSPPTTDPRQLTKLRAVFQNVKNTTVIIESKEEWGEWNKPVLIEGSWHADLVVPWPIDEDIVPAANLKRDAGYPAPFFTCRLRNPLPDTTGKLPEQPYYIFGAVDSTWYFVGVYDKKVYVEKNVGLKLQFAGGNKEITARK